MNSISLPPLLKFPAEFQKLTSILLAFVGFSLPNVASAQSNDENLLQFLPRDFGFVFHLRDLRGHAEKAGKAEWLHELAATGLGKKLLQSPEMGKLREFDAQLRQVLGLTWKELRDDFLGQQLVVLYAPERKIEQARERGLIMLRARDADRLQAVWQKFTALMKQQGEWKNIRPVNLEPGVAYHRVEHSQRSHFFALQGKHLFLSNDERWIREALRRKSEASETKSAWIVRLEHAGVANHFATLAIQPAYWSVPGLDGTPLLTKEPLPPKILQQLWQSLDTVIVSAVWDKDLGADLILQARTDDVPEVVRAHFTESPRASTAWDGLPENALFRFAGRLDFNSLSKLFLELTPSQEQGNVRAWLTRPLPLLAEKIGPRQIGEGIGPDFGLAMLPPQKGQRYPHYLAVLAVPAGHKPAIDQLVVATAKTVATLAIHDLNQKYHTQLKLRSQKQGSIEVQYVDGLPEPFAEFQPALAIKQGFLVAASHPDVVRNFEQRPKSPSSGSGSVPIAQLSLDGLKRFLDDRRELMLRQIQGNTVLSRQEASDRIQELLALLRPFENMRLLHHAGDGQFRWSLRLTVQGRSR